MACWAVRAVVDRSKQPSGHLNDESVLAQFKKEGDGVRGRMPLEIVTTIAPAVDRAKRVIDVGCGVGDLLSAVAAINPNADLAGCDFSGAAIAKAQRTLKQADLRQITIDRSLPYEDASFDLVLSTDLLEHLEYPSEIVAELVRICRPGGVVAIVVPDGDVDQFFGHLWFFNEARLISLLSPWSGRISRLPDCREFMGIIDRNR